MKTAGGQDSPGFTGSYSSHSEDLVKGQAFPDAPQSHAITPHFVTSVVSSALSYDPLHSGLCDV